MMLIRENSKNVGWMAVKILFLFYFWNKLSRKTYPAEKEKEQKHAPETQENILKSIAENT